MHIDRHNCDAFFLDYHEGNLSPVAAGEVLLFLEENPDLKEAFEEYENISLEKEDIPFPGKTGMGKKYSAEGIEELLSSEITAENCEQFFIAYAEGQLSEERISRMNIFLENNPARRKEFDLFRQCKLSAGHDSMEGKDGLKKHLITKENREEYFIRSAEKDLSRAEEEALKLFIEKHPEYKKELELFAKAILPSEHMTFERKDFLKRAAISKDNSEAYFIRSAEGDLSQEEAALLAAFLLANPGYRKEHELYAKAVLPAEAIVFDDKSSLKRKDRRPVVVPLFSRQSAYYAAAAAILLLAGIFFFFRSDDTTQTYIAHATPDGGSQSSALSSQPSALGPQSSVVSPQPSALSPQPSVVGRPSSVISRQPSVVSPQPSALGRQPVVTDDTEVLLAENEGPKLEMMKEEDAALKVIIVAPTAAMPAATAPKADEYQTLGAFARGKIRSALGIDKSAECGSPDEKLTIWDLAMAAKGGIQKLVGTKVDMNKVCDGTGEKVEYVFAAGNFEISKSAAR